jgi:hydroxymethylpyrimidine/phosphomethylpyrimidine kinase
MTKRAKQPIALTIAGSDSGGGAGIQADLKTFASLGVHGACAITGVTAQNPRRILAIEPCGAEIVRRQIEAVFAELPPDGVKTGMLCASGIIEVVAKFFKREEHPPLIVDPVMIATSGKRLLEPTAIQALRYKLLPVAALITPNTQETAVLLGRPVRTVEHLRQAARQIYQQFGCAALVKGGHLTKETEAVDFYYDGREELLLKGPRIRGITTHGTGCTYSAAIAGYCALGCKLARAVTQAKEYITQAIARSNQAAKHPVLNWFWG